MAKHNAHVRLATLRYAMLEHLKRPPPFFERAVKAHFYYKRDEVRGRANPSAAGLQPLFDSSCRRAQLPAAFQQDVLLQGRLRPRWHRTGRLEWCSVLAVALAHPSPKSLLQLLCFPLPSLLSCS